MYKIVRLKGFDKALNKLIKSGLKEAVLDDLEFVAEELSQGKTLPINFRDHKLHGELDGSRSCHIRGDLVLVYRIFQNVLIIEFLDIGKHAQVYK